MTRASDTAKLLGAGATILDGTTISTADNTEQLTLTSTDADATTGPLLKSDHKLLLWPTSTGSRSQVLKHPLT